MIYTSPDLLPLLSISAICTWKLHHTTANRAPNFAQCQLSAACTGEQQSSEIPKGVSRTWGYLQETL